MHGLYDVFEKLYFKSFEDRERIISRVQINFTIYMGMLTVIFYMLRMLDHDEKKFPLIIFFIILLSCLISLLTSIYFTYKTLCDKYNYHYFTSFYEMSKYLARLHEYRNNMHEYNITDNNEFSLEDINFIIKSNIFAIIGKCSDENNRINKNRMFFVRKSMLWLWFSGALFVMTSAIFAVTDLDVSSPRKDTLVKDRAVADEIKNFGQHVIDEMRSIMRNDEKNKLDMSKNPHEKAISQQRYVDLKPTLPVPPTYQIITESYDFKKWTED
ncbi:hypothetical protein [Sodalis ligni]|uniref:Uncharacterized protein n=1 Tax=Sodalis ligni TaxID=2697027 RepID=A0A4V2Q2P9_9GAMM|nr:hypothetical protein [Sodalis ligni]TCL03698.1 hypothetical protein EZJ58_1776 [Sodalis ligni]